MPNLTVWYIWLVATCTATSLILLLTGVGVNSARKHLGRAAGFDNDWNAAAVACAAFPFLPVVIAAGIVILSARSVALVWYRRQTTRERMEQASTC